MGTIEKVTISLPAEMVAEIRAAVAAGEFTSTSEAIRDAVRHWRRSRTELRRLVADGRMSGEPVDGEAALMHLRAKYAALATERER